MGANQGKGLISVKLDNHDKPVPAGGVISGCVYLWVRTGPSPANPLPTNALFLKLVGVETGCGITIEPRYHQSQDGELTYRDTPIEHMESRHFLDAQIPLASFPSGSLSNGHYEYPFTLRLPNNLSGRKGIRRSQVPHFYVRYFVYALLDLPSEIIQPSSAEVFVSKPSISLMRSPSVMVPVTKALHRQGNLYVGQVSFMAQLMDTKLLPGQTATVHYAISNCSSVKFVSIDLEFWEYSYVRGKGHVHTNQKCLMRTSFSLRGVTCALPQISIPQENGSTELPKHVLASMQQSMASFTFTVPKCNTSYYGDLGKLSHSVVLKLRSNDYRIIDNLRYDIPGITVLKKGPSRRMTGYFWPEKPLIGYNFSLPSDWQPIRAHTVELSFPEYVSVALAEMAVQNGANGVIRAAPTSVGQGNVVNGDGDRTHGTTTQTAVVLPEPTSPPLW